jgi:hypothetical protein
VRVNEEKEIVFYSVVPLYREEMELKLRAGADELLERFTRKGMTDVIDPARKNLAKKAFGLF